jgi:N-acetylmuramoyl-L-alanine amidase
MSYKKVVMSSGHGKLVQGASGILNEVDEARKVVEATATKLRERGAQVQTFHDDVSTTQSENLERIVDYHNSQDRELDISVHFNAYIETANPMGVEVLYVSQSKLAADVSLAISEAARFINRGPKLRNDLYFLNNTNKPSILIETCFVDSEKDADLYGRYFDPICAAIAETLCPGGDAVEPAPAGPETLSVSGKVSHFGGPKDMGVSPDEGLAFIQEVEDAPHLFLPHQPKGTTGLARRLNPAVYYIACRWDYGVTPHEMLLNEKALVRVPGGRELRAFPADWGPHTDTGRVADISPGLMKALQITTDSEVEVIFPA